MKLFSGQTVAVLALLAAAAQTGVALGAVSVKDLAIQEARACDKDHNNKIEGVEAFALRAAFKNPKSYLYIFDDNSDHFLDDREIAKIPLGPPPAKPAAAAKPAPAKPQHATRRLPVSHPHGAPH